MNYCKLIVAGNITRDPQLSMLPSKTPVVEFGVAVNRKWKDKDGGQKEEVMFLDCRAYAKTAELINQHFTKGKPIFLEGRLQFDQWEKDGQKHSKHRMMVESFQFVGNKEDAPQNTTRPAVRPKAAPVEPLQEAPAEDCPF